MLFEHILPRVCVHVQVSKNTCHLQSPAYSSLPTACHAVQARNHLIFSQNTFAGTETTQKHCKTSNQHCYTTTTTTQPTPQATECRHTWVSSTEASLKLESRPPNISCCEAVHHGRTLSSAGTQSTKAGALLSSVYDVDTVPSSVRLTSQRVWFREDGTSFRASCALPAAVRQFSWQFSSSSCKPSSDDGELISSVKNRLVHSYPCCNEQSTQNTSEHVTQRVY